MEEGANVQVTGTGVHGQGQQGGGRPMPGNYPLSESRPQSANLPINHGAAHRMDSRPPHASASAGSVSSNYQHGVDEPTGSAAILEDGGYAHQDPGIANGGDNGNGVGNYLPGQYERPAHPSVTTRHPSTSSSGSSSSTDSSGGSATTPTNVHYDPPRFVEGRSAVPVQSRSTKLITCNFIIDERIALLTNLAHTMTHSSP